MFLEWRILNLPYESYPPGCYNTQMEFVTAREQAVELSATNTTNVTLILSSGVLSVSLFPELVSLALFLGKTTLSLVSNAVLQLQLGLEAIAVSLHNEAVELSLQPNEIELELKVSVVTLTLTPVLEEVIHGH